VVWAPHGVEKPAYWPISIRSHWHGTTVINLEISEKGAESFATMRTIRMALADGYGLAITNAAAVALGALRYGPTMIMYVLFLLPLMVPVYRRLRFARRS
jgi:hypothetical protein